MKKGLDKQEVYELFKSMGIHVEFCKKKGDIPIGILKKGDVPALDNIIDSLDSVINKIKPLIK
ncbi:hypothetical protein [Psychrobacillus phage Perkons]|nr:hypothetical protein [Psychrobacillus phage Perkons]